MSQNLDISHLPEFPNFTQLELIHENLIINFLSNKKILSSDYAFYNLWGWYKTKPTQISRFAKDFIILAVEGPEKQCLVLPPIGFGNIKDVLFEIFNYFEKRGCPKTLSYVPKLVKDEILENFPNITIYKQENHFDYIYSRKYLAELSGRKYHQKKNFVNRVLEEYNPKVEIYSDEMYNHVITFLEEWYKDYGIFDETTVVEKLALERCIKIITKINAFGIIVKISNNIVGFSIASKLTENCWVVTVEKANRHYKGLYQYLNWITANYIPSNVEFINREADLGLDGLKQAKQSYHPIMLEEKYIIIFDK